MNINLTALENDEEAEEIPAYDNQGAYNQLQLLMARNERLTVKFYTSPADNTPCAWIESKHVPDFRYILKEEAFDGFMLYLTEGAVSDFDPDPSDFEPLPDGSPDYGEDRMKKLVEEGKTIQWVPLYRERLRNISGVMPCRMGRIYLRVARNAENLDYLREYKQAI